MSHDAGLNGCISAASNSTHITTSCPEEVSCAPDSASPLHAAAKPGKLRSAPFCRIFLTQLLNSSSLYRSAFFLFSHYSASFMTLPKILPEPSQGIPTALAVWRGKKWCYLSVLPPKCHLLSCTGWWHSQELAQTLDSSSWNSRELTSHPVKDGVRQLWQKKRKTQGWE